MDNNIECNNYLYYNIFFYDMAFIIFCAYSNLSQLVAALIQKYLDMICDKDELDCMQWHFFFLNQFKA